MDKDLSMEQIKGIPRLDTSLLPIYQKERAEETGFELDIWNYLGHRRADLDLMGAFTKLFWPDFVEVEDCVILQPHYYPDNFTHWMEYFKGNRPEVESMINHLHIWDLFMNRTDAERRMGEDFKYPEELAEFLANALMITWKQALQDTYPDKRFVFTLRHGYGPEISFHQVRPER